MSASPEFVALCRSQVALLTQTFGASLGVVYLTHQIVEGGETQLVPVFAYPETAVAWQDMEGWALPSDEIQAMSASPAVLSADLTSPDLMTTLHLRSEMTADSEVQFTVEPPNHTLSQPRQIVIPLMQDEGMLGFLVTGREDRAWTDWEHTQIERIAETLAIACVLDQRYQWLEQAHHQQEILQARQRDLMDNLLHQFRSPLTALKTFGKLLLKRLLPSDTNREVASSIIRESDRLNELLQQLDQVADLGNANSPYLRSATKDPNPDLVSQQLVSLPPTAQPILLPASGLSSNANFQVVIYPLADCLEPLLASAAAIAQEGGLSLQTSIPSDMPLVLVNPLALREVLSNLIDNALKYTPTGGEVFLQVGAQRTTEFGIQQAIELSDTGPGIPPQDLEHLFERHYRGVQATGEIPGTGLGLAIAQELIQQMRGEIQVFSPALPEAIGGRITANPGTTFRVWLPIAPQP
ncbi:MAG: HAMP domain-containing histidine kinase [Scytolyngbya sp. HA4215-MV1]|nr:HAMP domain-containing histidine kinase [Scytolyngbya sp. HA4215-MV1]